ncbi:hypothetical protein EYF80_067759 [Liparis tanakae]|uniref:Uncharacterized protein n=1 Tax=Liparis tanakae TaxID=230148 RepID=A0A4Z2E086_9TELE|nr:hypothetical protein EYF80_067759 [Liparis tanakae]
MERACWRRGGAGTRRKAVPVRPITPPSVFWPTPEVDDTVEFRSPR